MQQDAVIKKMNDDLNLYIPAGVEDENSVYSYELLFFYLRKMHYLYSMVSKEEVAEIFTNFYHASEAEKAMTLNELENKLESEKRMRELIEKEYNDVELARIYALADLLPEEEQAKFLYFLDNDEEPDETTDLSQYIKAIQDVKAAQEAQMQQQMQGVYPAAMSPEEVAQRYLENEGDQNSPQQ